MNVTGKEANMKIASCLPAFDVAAATALRGNDHYGNEVHLKIFCVLI